MISVRMNYSVDKIKGASKMEIAELRRENEKAWDSYVLNSDQSTFYHQLRSVLIQLFHCVSLMVEKTYKHKPIYLIAKEYMPGKLFIKAEHIEGSFL
ncbi:MAG TPA: hypothetical protein HA348_05840 [Thermoplasmata archaeon]|nr:hypothetical protein [Thermoplasmata archaeon]